MKKIFGVLSVLLLIVALAGGVYLASQNQETRRGAATDETFVTLIPSEIKKKVGDEFKVTVMMNSLEGKVSGADLTIKYGPELEVVKIEPLLNYGVKETKVKGEIKLELSSSAAADSEASGTFEIAKISFKAVADGSGKIMPSGKFVILSSTEFQEYKTLTGADYQIGDVTVRDFSCEWCGKQCVSSLVKENCTQELPLEGTSCEKVNNVCTVVGGGENKKAECGSICREYDECGKGMVCTPVWWPIDCPKILGETFQLTKTYQGKMVEAEAAKKIFANCPSLENSDLISENTLRLPSFIGKCKLTSGKMCSQFGEETGITPMPTITPTEDGKANLSLKWNLPKSLSSVRVDETVGLKLIADAGVGKISSVKTSFSFPVKYFDLVSAEVNNKATVQEKTIVDGVVKLYLTFSTSEDNLSSSFEVISLKLKAKEMGKDVKVVFGDRSLSEVNGAYDGKSIAYKLNLENSTGIDINESRLLCKTCTTATKTVGDADCSGVIDSVDFEYWRRETFDLGGDSGLEKSWDADFDCDLKVSGVDFEIWRKQVFQ